MFICRSSDFVDPFANGALADRAPLFKSWAELPLGGSRTTLIFGERIQMHVFFPKQFESSYVETGLFMRKLCFFNKYCAKPI
jgi:hypothetical protein